MRMTSGSWIAIFGNSDSSQLMCVEAASLHRCKTGENTMNGALLRKLFNGTVALQFRRWLLRVAALITY